MKNWKRLAALLTAAVLTLVLPATALAAVNGTGLTDVDAGSWYAEAVLHCREHNLMLGTSDTTFAPEGNLTRAMLVTVLWRQARSPVVNDLMQFSDVAEGQWYSEAVRWAASEQLVLGYGDGRFGTEDSITQAQLNMILKRYSDQPVTQGIPGFVDGDSPATRAQTAAVMLNLSKIQNDPVSSPGDGNKVLVAYFSATNTTKPLAEYISDSLNADLYEIVPQTPYTSADLNYGSSSSRTSIEMNDPNARPAISGSVANMSDYDIVFLGYPIWWGEAPRIVSTFLESYDFNGKTIVPFCTSGSSGIGSSARNLHSLTDGANWLDGRRFSGGTSRNTMVEWVNGLGLNVTAN